MVKKILTLKNRKSWYSESRHFEFKRFKKINVQGNPSYFDSQRKMYSLINKLIREYSKNDIIAEYLVLYGIDIVTNKIRGYTISAIDLASYKNFKAVMELVEEGEYRPGSDQFDRENYMIFYNRFSLRLINVGRDKRTFNKFTETAMIYQIDTTYEKLKKETDECGYNCLKYLIKDLDLSLEDYKKLELNIVDNLSEFCKQNGISFLNNSFICDNEAFEGAKKYKKKYLPNPGCNKLIYLENYFYKLTDFNGEKEPSIIYDSYSEHCTVSHNSQYKDLYIGGNRSFYREKDGILYRFESQNKMIKKLEKSKRVCESKVETKYIFFDYETIIDFKQENMLVPYSLAFCVLSKDELKQLEAYDKSFGNEKDESEREKFKEHIDTIVKNNSNFYYGKDCTKYLYEFMKKNSTDKCYDEETDNDTKINTRYELISFNGANFDNIILYNDLVNLDNDSVSEEFFNNSQLLKFKIFGVNKVWDLAKFLVGSLQNNCIGYKVNTVSKLCISHYEAQRMYDNGTLEKYIKSNDKIKKYNIYDCLSCAVIFERFKNALLLVPELEKYAKHITDYPTLGSFMQTVLIDNCKKKGYNIDSMTSKNVVLKKKKATVKEKKELLIKFYNSLKKDRTGGRCDNNEFIIKLTEKLSSLDVCSLYPYVMFIMKDCYYPVGKIYEATKDDYEKIKDDKIGFFYCDVLHQSLNKQLINILCEKTKIDNNWNKEYISNVLISIPMIKLLKKYGAYLTIRNGYYFEDKVRGCDLFSCLLPLMEIKNNEDIKKENKEEDYNPALREAIKLCLNILSGKLNQRVYTEKIKFLNWGEYLENLKKYKDDKIEKLVLIDIKRDKYMCSITSKEDEEITRTLSYLQIGSLIYDYSKIHMYENIYSKIPKSFLYYTDTDSVKIPEKMSNILKKQLSKIPVSHWKDIEKIDPRYKKLKMYNEKEKIFGSLEDEYKDYKNQELSYHLGKKQYVLFAEDNYGNKVTKLSFKGINKNDFIIPQKIIDKYYDLKKGMLVKKKLNDKQTIEYNIEIYRTYEDEKLRVSKLTKSDQQKYQYCKWKKIFEKLYRTGNVILITSSLKKVVKNLKNNKGKNENLNKKSMTLKAGITTKQIKIDKEKIKLSLDRLEKRDSNYQVRLMLKNGWDFNYKTLDGKNYIKNYKQ